jgi:hypothetical protein
MIIILFQKEFVRYTSVFIDENIQIAELSFDLFKENRYAVGNEKIIDTKGIIPVNLKSLNKGEMLKVKEKKKLFDKEKVEQDASKIISC